MADRRLSSSQALQTDEALVNPLFFLSLVCFREKYFDRGRENVLLDSKRTTTLAILREKVNKLH
jgi:hypothetical protein